MVEPEGHHDREMQEYALRVEFLSGLQAGVRRDHLQMVLDTTQVIGRLLKELADKNLDHSVLGNSLRGRHSYFLDGLDTALVDSTIDTTPLHKEARHFIDLLKPTTSPVRRGRRFHRKRNRTRPPK